MDKISNVTLVELTSPKFLKPYRVNFRQNKKDRSWECIQSHNSVVIIIFNVSRNVLVFVKQFRPPVFVSNAVKGRPITAGDTIDTGIHRGEDGVTLELCAGIMDKTEDLAVTAQEEVLEECGYQVPVDRLQRIVSFPRYSLELIVPGARWQFLASCSMFK